MRIFFGLKIYLLTSPPIQKIYSS